jgi:NADH-quinone oxidoreductase subunit M
MDLPDMTRTETVCAGLLVVCILVLGLWPAPLLDLIAGSVGRVAGLFGS